MRIIVADQHAKVRRALVALIVELPEFSLVGEVSNTQDLITLAEESAADLILLDQKLSGVSTVDLYTRLHDLEPRPYLIVMSSDPESSRMILLAGADSFVSKSDQPEWLIQNLKNYAQQFSKFDVKEDHP